MYGKRYFLLYPSPSGTNVRYSTETSKMRDFLRWVGGHSSQITVPRKASGKDIHLLPHPSPSLPRDSHTWNVHHSITDLREQSNQRKANNEAYERGSFVIRSRGVHIRIQFDASGVYEQGLNEKNA